MASRVSLKDIARETGFAVSTVSLALRDKKWVSPQKREKILAVAKRLGYRADPIYSTLGRRAREGRKSAGLGLALLFDESHDPKHRADFRNRFEPIIEQRGCFCNVLEVDPGTQPGQVRRILRTRNISGVLIPRVPRRESSIGQLDLEEVSVIAEVGRWTPPYHTVHSDYFEALHRLCAELYRRGHRRLGFGLLFTEPPALDDYRRYGGFAGFHTVEHPELPLLPPWRPEPRADRKTQRKSFDQWLREHRPDAVIGFNVHLYWLLQDLGLRAPEDIACAGVMIDEDQPVGGMRVHPRLDEILVDHLIADILSGLRGHAMMNRRSLVSMEFLDHPSLG